MQVYHGNFEHLSFTKTGKDIIEKANRLIEWHVAKIEDRKKRCDTLRTDLGMETPMDVLLSMDEIAHVQYSNGARPEHQIGRLSALKHEVAAIQKQEAEVTRLRLIVRNLDPAGSFNLDFAELTYFGF
jgi:hypothetical protein